MKKVLWSIGLCVLIFSSCSDYQREGSLKAYLGDFGDAMVVCERPLWESEMGDSIRVLFTDYVPAIMPAQGQLDLEYCSPNNFKGSAKRFRNIIYLDVGDRLANQKPNIKITKSEFALDQLIVYAYAKTEQDMITLLSERFNDIHNKINDEEVLRKQKALSYREDTSAVQSVHLKKGYDIIIPEKYTVQIDSGNVLWMNKISSTSKDNLEKYTVKDVVVFTYEYDSEEVFRLENLLAKRDEVMKKITFSEDDSTYVRHQEKLEPTVRLLNGGKDYKMEIRSLWTREGAFEGGPAIQYIQLDYDNRRVIHADARVYAAGSYKREIIRELEGIIKSIKPLKN